MSQPDRIEIRIDIAAIREIALRGIRRASAFLGLALRATRDGPPTSVLLDNDFSVRWSPDPLPKEVAEELAREYDAWIVGAALKELDLYFALFLDEAWEIIRLSDFHNHSPPAGYQRDTQFQSNTNVGNKLSQVEQALAVSSLDSEYFDGFSRARNALSHNAGIVRDRDANSDNALTIRWRAPQLVIQTNDGEHIIDQRTGVPNRTFTSDDKVVFRMVPREVMLSIGDSITLTPTDLRGICCS